MIFVQTLGTALIHAGQSRVSPASTRKFALLLYVASDPGRRISRSALQELVFPDQTDKNGGHSLRELVYQLRQRGTPLESDTYGISLAPTQVRSDYREFLEGGAVTVELLRAIEGGFLPGYAPDHSESFTEWLAGYRARVSFDLCRALLREISRARKGGDWEAIGRAARACLALDPLNEEGTLALAEAFVFGGSKIGAVQLLNSYIAEVGNVSPDLRISPSVLRRRIGEKLPERDSKPAPPPLIGRDLEMSFLNERLTLACSGETQCLVIAGEPGVGKSRLSAEFALVASLDGAHVERASAQPHDVQRPMGVFIDLVAALLCVPGALGCSPDSMEALRGLTSSPQWKAGTLTKNVSDSEDREYAIVRAIGDLIDAITSETPLVLLIEDAHWIDRVSLHCIGDIISTRRQNRLFILLTTRESDLIRAFPPYADRIGSLTVRNLESPASSRLIAALIHDQSHEMDEPMRQWIVTTGAGNPLFLETLVAHYVRTGERFAVPPTLAALLGRRLDSLSAHARTVLQFCVLLGKNATLSLLADAIQLPRIDLLPVIAELERARLVHDDNGRLAPAHPLIAEIAEQQLSPLERRFAHRCIATVLEPLATDSDSAALGWDCAEHWLRAQEAAKALDSVRRCAAHAMAIGRPRAAAEMLLRTSTLHLRPDEQTAIGRDAVLAADAANEPELVFRAMTLLREKQGPREHDEIEFAKFRAVARTFQDASDLEGQLLSCVVAVDASPDHRVAAATSLLKYCDAQGKRTVALNAIAALSEEVLRQATALTRLEFLLVRHAGFGDSTEAAAIATEILTRCSGATSAARLRIQLNASLAYWRAGCLKRAIETALACFEESTKANAYRSSLNSALRVAEFYFDSGREEFGREWLQRSFAITRDVPGLANEFGLIILSLESAFEDGDAVGARELFARAIKEGQFAGGYLRHRWQQALALRLRQVSGEHEATAAEIDDLLTEKTEASPLVGLRDFEIATVCHAFVGLGRSGDARSLIEHYLGSGRRTKAPLSRVLRHATQRPEVGLVDPLLTQRPSDMDLFA